MKTRFLRIIWVSSVLWIGLIMYGGLFGSAKDELVLNLIVFGWPAGLGLILCYFVGGSFLWPDQENTDSETMRPLRTIDLEPKKETASRESNSADRFLNTLDQSRQSVMVSLENERQKMLDDWNAMFGEEFERLEQAKLTIRASEVIDALLKVIEETDGWNSYLDCDLKDELIPEWMSARLFPIDTSNKESVEFLKFNQQESEGVEKEIGTLDECLGLKIDDMTLEYFVYKLSEDSSYTKHGRAQVFVNSQCVLEIPLRQPLGQYRWSAGYEIFIAVPGVWMSSILNLSNEFQGRALIEEQTMRLKEKEFFLKQSNPQASRK